jgi:hypothetical protein
MASTKLVRSYQLAHALHTELMTDLKDPWLQPWLALVRERAGNAPVLELGCGSGRDTATLV